jgi:hypothetical protein
MLERRVAHGLTLFATADTAERQEVATARGSARTIPAMASKAVSGEMIVSMPYSIYGAVSAAVVLEVIKRSPISDKRAPTSFPLIP